MTELHDQPPKFPLPLSRVGIEGVRKLVRIPKRDENHNILLLNINCYVNLPSNLKGVHMSRNLEAINEILEDAMEKGKYKMENLAKEIAKKILEKHNYASLCEVNITTKYMVRKHQKQKFVKLFFDVILEREKEPVVNIGGKIRGEIGGRVVEAMIKVENDVDAKEIINILFDSLKNKSVGEAIEEATQKCKELKLKGKIRYFVEYPDYVKLLECKL